MTRELTEKNMAGTDSFPFRVGVEEADGGNYSLSLLYKGKAKPKILVGARSLGKGSAGKDDKAAQGCVCAARRTSGQVMPCTIPMTQLSGSGYNLKTGSKVIVRGATCN